MRPKKKSPATSICSSAHPPYCHREEPWFSYVLFLRPPKPPAKPEEKEAKRPLPQKTLVVTLMTNKGEVVRLKAADVRRVRPTDPEFAARLDRALDALSTRSAQLNRPLTLLGDAQGAITFGYIAETPIWRTTYRLLLAPEGRGGALQGWALLHNDTDESWANVKLSLVNGQPDSFVYPLAAPRYLRRSLGCA